MKSERELKDHLWFCCVRQEMPFLGQINIEGSSYSKGFLNPNHFSRGHRDIMTNSDFWPASRNSCCPLMARGLSDIRDIGREMWQRICVNISSSTVHYKHPWCGVRRDGCNPLRQKIFKGGVLCIRNSLGELSVLTDQEVWWVLC